MDSRSPALLPVLLLVPLLAALVGLPACGFGSSSDATTAVATAPALDGGAASFVSPSAGPPSAPPSGAAPPSQTPIPTIDRAHDAAFIVSSRTQAETLVLSIDRLTVAGVDDAALAANGIPVAPDPGDRFGNQREALYDVGVAAGAVFVVTTCSRAPDGTVATSSKPLTGGDFLASVPADAPVIITYTDGLLTRAEVNPRC